MKLLEISYHSIWILSWKSKILIEELSTLLPEQSSKHMTSVHTYTSKIYIQNLDMTGEWLDQSKQRYHNIESYSAAFSQQTNFSL